MKRNAWCVNTGVIQRLGKNRGGYHGKTIDIAVVLQDCLAVARNHGWTSETFLEAGESRLFALRRQPLPTFNSQPSTRIYISAGIHGDEPAGPLAALQLLRDDDWPANLEVRLLPCLNPTGFPLNRRENLQGRDLNRDYRHGQTAEIRAHIAWLSRQPALDLSLCLHEDWEAHGFYVYELNPDRRPSLAERMVERVARLCPIDASELIEGRPAQGGIIRPTLNPAERPEWPEAFYLITNKTRLSYTLEAPSDYPLPMRVGALVEGVKGALAAIAR